MPVMFGSGTAVFTPSNLNAALLSDVTPTQPILIQETTVDFKADQKMLYGRLGYAIDAARGKVTTTGKAKLASMDLLLMNQLFFGMPTSTGSVRNVQNEPHPDTAPVTVVPPGGGAFVADQGVVYADTGVPLRLVPAAPAIGQYSVNVATGQYTFASADPDTTVLISYSYSSATAGTTINIANQNMGYNPEFAMQLFQKYRNKQFSLNLFRCMMTDLSIPTKQDDFWVADLSYAICANPAGLIGSFYVDN